MMAARNHQPVMTVGSSSLNWGIFFLLTLPFSPVQPGQLHTDVPTAVRYSILQKTLEFPHEPPLLIKDKRS